MKKRLLKIARAMKKLRKQLMKKTITIERADALTRVADAEIRAIVSAALIS